MQLAAYLQIHSCLRHTQWDTRVAASTCLGLMAAHFTHHSVITLAEAAEPAAAASPVKVEELGAPSAMSFQNFNISQVLQQGTALVASGGQVCPFALYCLRFLCKGQSNVMSSCFRGLVFKCELLDSNCTDAAFQEYEALPEEGTRAEQLAKQQKNLKMR